MGQARRASQAGLGVRRGVWKGSALPWLRPLRWPASPSITPLAVQPASS